MYLKYEGGNGLSMGSKDKVVEVVTVGYAWVVKLRPHRNGRLCIFPWFKVVREMLMLL